MILLTRLNGAAIGVNADLIERLDATPDTVITLVDGKKYIVVESIEDVVDAIVRFRARVLANVEACTSGAKGSVGPPEAQPALRLVSEREDKH